MAASIIAQRYAKALYQAATEAKELKEAEKLAGELSAALADDEISGFMARREISLAQKLALLESGFGKKLTGTVHRCMQVVFENHREGELKAVLDAFLEQLARDRKETKAGITTALPLSAAQRKTIENGLSRKLKRKVELVPLVDPSIIGGAILRLDNTVYDSSLKRQLVRMKAALMAEPRPKKAKQKVKAKAKVKVKAKAKVKPKAKAPKKAVKKKKK